MGSYKSRTIVSNYNFMIFHGAFFSISDHCDTLNCSNCQIVPDKNGQALPLCYCDPTKAIVNKTECVGKYIVYVRIFKIVLQSNLN